MSVHCKMGPRCTPEIPGRRARMHVVSSCAARSPEFRLSSQAFLSEPRNGSALRYSRSSWLLMHNQVGSGWTPAEGALLIKHRPALASTPVFSLTTATRCYNGSFGFVFCHVMCFWTLNKAILPWCEQPRLCPYHGPNTTTFEIFLVTGSVPPPPLIMPSGNKASRNQLVAHT